MAVRDTSPYREYLQNELTIAGVLATFIFGAAAFMIKVVS